MIIDPDIREHEDIFTDFGTVFEEDLNRMYNNIDIEHFIDVPWGIEGEYER